MRSKIPFSPFASLPAIALLAIAFTGCDFLPQATSADGDQASASPNATTDAQGATLAEAADLMPMGAPVIDDGSGNGLAKLTGDPIMWKSDLEDQTSTCWGPRNSSGYVSTACGEWGGIGSLGAKLSENGISRSGTKSLSFTYSKNEDVAGAGLTLSANVVDVRAYYYFAPGYDFGQGVKIARVSSFNDATQMNDIDIVSTVRSRGGSNQCGTTDMADMGLFFNGRPVGFDWGNLTVPVSFQRGRWYEMEYQVFLNTPGLHDGWVKVWIDGVQVGTKTGLNIRGNGGWNVKLNRVRVGGWYSNSANGNSCANPAQASTMYVDDVAVSTQYIGPN
ncbi:MAG: hypothetical protein JF616_09945 [Fibrobacteres bacterium]|nr:hypothetical protein [Fibrobacterota bacterium]